MKSFLQHIKEEVLPTVQVADGGLDIEKPAVRAAINAAIAGVVSQPAVTPYVVFNRLSKLLAQYHIVLPKKFLEGDKGVEVFEIKQFGHRMGMTDSGEFVNHVPTTHYLFLQYGIITPMGVTYAKPLVGGMFRVTARLVDRVELDRLLDMAEITMSEEAECMQAIAKANAPKEPMQDITDDPKKVGNKKAVGASEKDKIDEGVGEPITGSRRHPGSSDRKRKAVQMALGRKHKDHPEHNPRINPQTAALKLGRKLQKQGVSEELSHGARELTLHADNDSQLHRSSHQPIIKNLQRKHAKGTYDHDKATKLWGYHANRAAKSYEKQHGGKFSVADRKAAASHFADSARDEHGFGSVKEDKDPCWKGYEMIGMKKKGGRKVPNCVPTNEENLHELTGKGKLPQMKADYQAAKKIHSNEADWHAARADRAERRGESKKAEHHMDAGYGHEHKAERAGSKLKRANALMTRAKAAADIKSSKAASKTARAEYKSMDEEKGDKITTAPVVNPNNVKDLVKDMASGERGYTFAARNPMGGVSRQMNISSDSPQQRSDKFTNRAPLDEKAPPGREKQVLALKKKFPKGSGSPFAIAWSSYNKSKGE